MKGKISLAEAVIGFVFLLGGLLLYGLGVHELLPVPRPELVAAGAALVGAGLVAAGVCDLFSKKSKEQEIEEKDERNVAIANAAMATAYKALSVALSAAVFVLIFTGHLSAVPCFTMIGVYFLGQIVFVWRLWYLQKKM